MTWTEKFQFKIEKGPEIVAPSIPYQSLCFPESFILSREPEGDPAFPTLVETGQLKPVPPWPEARLPRVLTRESF